MNSDELCGILIPIKVLIKLGDEFSLFCHMVQLILEFLSESQIFINQFWTPMVSEVSILAHVFQNSSAYAYT